MKRILKPIISTIFVSLLFLTSYSRERAGYSNGEPIFINDKTSGGNKENRAPARIPIRCEYESYISSIIVTFTESLGEVDVEVINLTTGENLTGTISGEVGTQVIPISGTESDYTITFTLTSGFEYYGEFKI